MAKTRLPIVRLPARLDNPVNLGAHVLEQSAALRIVLIDRQIVVRLTPIEYRIFTHLVARPRTLVSAHDLTVIALQTKGNHQDLQMPQSVERHISSLRHKLQHTGLSIRRVVTSGWLLTDEQDEEEVESTAQRAIS